MASDYGQHRGSSRKVLIGICVALAAALVILLVLLGLYIFYEKDTASNVYAELTVEAGTASIDPGALLVEPDGDPIAIEQGLTPEQLCTPGDYPLVFKWRDRRFSTRIHVVDTVKPSGTAQDLTAMGPVPAASDFVTSVDDVTDVTVSYEEEPDMSVEGTRPVVLVLTDASGNSAKLTANITVIVDSQAPVISGVRNITVYLGGTVAYRANITVTDDLDPAPQLSVDNSAVDLNTAGKYAITYIATDSSGNETRKQATVDVREKQTETVDLDTINAAADKLLSQILKEGMTQREQVQAIYDWARSSCTYANHSDKSSYLQGAYQMLTKRSGDCFNYFAVTKLLFDRLGIQNIDVRKVKNHSADSDHYWSLVSLDDGNTWYHFDSTPRVGAGDDFCLVTDAFLDAYSQAHDNCHNRDKSLYPATPEN